MEKKKIACLLAAGIGIVGVAAFSMRRLVRMVAEMEEAEAPSHDEEAPEQQAQARPVPTMQPHSRVERMFGDRETWNTQGEEKKHAANPAGYKGFLFLQCEACGKESKFFYKYLATDWTCECGHVIHLNDDIRPAFAKCNKCEDRQIRYWTNSQKSTISIECHKCQAPIDLELNSRGTAYSTIGERK